MIRKLNLEDKEMYLTLAKEFYSSDAVFHEIPEKYIQATFEEMMRSDHYALGYALEHEGEMAGYALLAKTFSQEAGGIVLWLEELYIREAYRGLGLGKEMFEFLESSKGHDVTRIRLEVEEENENAVALYKKMGFKWLEYQQMIKEYPY